MAIETGFDIPAIEISTFELTLVGDSPLIVHAWSEKAKKEILDKQMKEAFYQAVAEGAEFGFPSVAFKAAAVSAGFRTGVTKNKTIPNSAFHINGDMVRIHGTPEIREDMVRVGMGAADLRYRGEFKEWSVILPIRFNTAVFTHEQIINLFNLGGFACGIGEWRPERGGSFGMYHVV